MPIFSVGPDQLLWLPSQRLDTIVGGKTYSKEQTYVFKILNRRLVCWASVCISFVKVRVHVSRPPANQFTTSYLILTFWLISNSLKLSVAVKSPRT